MAEWPCFVQSAGIARTRKQTSAVGPYIGEFFVYGICPICVEQGRSRGTVSQTEHITGNPLTSRHMSIKKGIGRIEHRSPAIPAVVIFSAERNIDKPLLWVIYVVIEEAIPHAHIGADKRVRRDQASGMGIGRFEVFNYSRCFEDQCSIVRQDGKLAKRP